MLFSIVIPVYNVEKYLHECIDAIMPQVVELEEGAEVLLIDDGSTDLSGDICEQYKVKYPEYIHVFHNKNQGLLMTRRFGFKHSKGEYILNCDSDDICEKTQIEELVKVIKQTKAEVILFNVYIFDGNIKQLFYNNVFTNQEIKILEKEEIYREYLLSNNVVSMCGKIFKRSCLNMDYDYTPYQSVNYGEDTLQSAEVYTWAKSIVYLNKPLYNYRIGSGMTASFNPNYYNNFKKVCLNLEEYKDIWNLPDFDKLFAIKVFGIVGRSITQSRYRKNMTRIERVQYLRLIREDSLVKRYEKYFKVVSKSLQKDYILLLALLFNNQYELIHLALGIKNLLG